MPTAPAPRFPLRFSTRLGMALAALALAGVAAADTRLVLKAEQAAAEVSGQRHEAIESTAEVWIGDGRISRNDDQSKIVLSADELVIANHAQKVYHVVPLPLDLAAMMPPELREQAAAWAPKAVVTAGDERREIGEWTARRYSVEVTNAMGLAVRTEMWTTTELEMDYAAYHRLARQMLALQPGTEALAKEMAKVEGFPVLQETTIDLGGSSVTTREELVAVEEKEPPADAYAPPEGYELTDFPTAGPPPA